MMITPNRQSMTRIAVALLMGAAIFSGCIASQQSAPGPRPRPPVASPAPSNGLNAATHAPSAPTIDLIANRNRGGLGFSHAWWTADPVRFQVILRNYIVAAKRSGYRHFQLLAIHHGVPIVLLDQWHRLSAEQKRVLREEVAYARSHDPAISKADNRLEVFGYLGVVVGSPPGPGTDGTTRMASVEEAVAECLTLRRELNISKIYFDLVSQRRTAAWWGERYRLRGQDQNTDLIEWWHKVRQLAAREGIVVGIEAFLLDPQRKTLSVQGDDETFPQIANAQLVLRLEREGYEFDARHHVDAVINIDGGTPEDWARWRATGFALMSGTEQLPN